MTYGTSLDVALPTVGDEVNFPGPLYATQMNLAVQACMDRLESKVTEAGLDLQGDVAFNDNAASELQAALFTNQAAVLPAATFPRALFFSGTDGNAYINDGAGRQVRLTVGGALDIASAGGITGSGYGAAGVEINWDSSAGRYRFKTAAAATSYANLEAGQVRMASGTTGFFGILAAGAAMVADRTWTLPAAYPASTSIVSVNTSGQLVLTRALSVDSVAMTGAASVGTTLTVTGAATLSSTLAVTSNATVGGTLGVTGAATVGGTLGVTGAASLSSTLGVAGLITATAGVTAAANQHLKVSGSGRFKHGDITQIVPSAAFLVSSGSGIITLATFGHWKATSGASVFFAPILLDVGKRIRSVTFNLLLDAAFSIRTVALKRTDTSTDTISTVDSATSSSSGAVTVSLAGLDHTITSFYDYWLQVLMSTDDYIKSVTIVYDDP